MPKNNKTVMRSGMVDVSHKSITKRIAVASAQISFNPAAFKQFITQGSPKGNVLETAKVAGILAAKSTPSIIPLCHPLILSKINVSFEIQSSKKAVIVFSEIVCCGQTGVEMEALCAVTAACLTIYDMMKWADKSIVISDVRLLKKTGGKSGNFERKQ